MGARREGSHGLLRRRRPRTGRTPSSVRRCGDNIIIATPCAAREASREGPFPVKVSELVDDDALRRGRPRAVHGLRQVPHGVAAHGQVLDEAEHAASIFRVDARRAGEVLGEQRTEVRVAKVRIRRERRHRAAREVGREARDFVGDARDVVLADVGQQDVGLVVPRGRRRGGVRRGEARGEDRLVEEGHLDELFLDVRRRAALFPGGTASAKHAVHRGELGGGADDDVADAGLADVRAAVVGREALDEVGREVGLAVHEDAVRRHEDVVEEDRHFLAAVLVVADVHRARGRFGRPRVARLSAEDVREPGRVDGDRAGHGVLGFVPREPLARHDDEIMRVERAGLVRLGAADDDAVGPPVDDANEEVGVGLARRSLGPIALGIGHRAADDEVVRLDVRDERAEAIVVRRPVSGVHEMRHRPARVDRVHADAPLEAGPRALSERALHEVLRDDVLGARAHVREPVHAAAYDVRERRRELGLRLGEAIRLGDGVHGWGDHRVRRVRRRVEALA
mmetsp:Transcript_430/g.1661  ORF Transcript_430/g.1661 Transcript_430/m.1661 type:complete len:510 (-) Transcript_430:387-1916(-)